MKKLYVVLFWASMVVSCQNKEVATKKFFNIDSLLDSQVSFLVKSKASITKFASVDTAEDKSTFTPDMEGWENELAVFRYLELINKPIYARAYKVEDGIKDSNSNLQVRVFTAKEKVPIKQLKIYYQEHPARIRKIEAMINEQNSLYYTSRKFEIELEEHQNQVSMTNFKVRGVQKMILRDSVNFVISSSINY